MECPCKTGYHRGQRQPNFLGFGLASHKQWGNQATQPWHQHASGQFDCAVGGDAWETCGPRRGRARHVAACRGFGAWGERPVSGWGPVGGAGSLCAIVVREKPQTCVDGASVVGAPRCRWGGASGRRSSGQQRGDGAGSPATQCQCRVDVDVGPCPHGLAVWGGVDESNAGPRLALQQSAIVVLRASKCGRARCASIL